MKSVQVCTPIMLVCHLALRCLFLSITLLVFILDSVPAELASIPVDLSWSAWPMSGVLNSTSLCSSISSCPTCLHTTFNCVWCGHSCQYAKCKEGLAHTKAIASPEHCQVADANSCRLLHRWVSSYNFCLWF